MFGRDPCQFRRKGRVIGCMECGASAINLGGVGDLTIKVDRLAIKIGDWAKAGCVLAGIKAAPRWVAVYVNDVAVDICANGCDARNQIGVKAFNMPISVGDRMTGCVQAGQAVGRYVRAGMRQPKNKRAIAVDDLNKAQTVISSPAASEMASLRTSSAARLISPAR